MINVTQPFLPEKKNFISYVDKIWDSKWLTNHGPLTKELEQKLAKYLGVDHLFLINNGTVALQIAIHSLGEPGEIIVTPFTYVATVSSIVWERFTPVFVDIDPQTLTIDVSKIEAEITPKTRAIMGVHVYGIPCNVEKIEQLAKKYDLKVIYDAAHAFGVRYKDKPIAIFGDMSVFSFHATKLFHTIEGGAIATNNDELAKKIKYYRNFGHETPETFGDVGINGKMNEFSAAMGLSILPDIETVISSRKFVSENYDVAFQNITNIQRPLILKEVKYNYSYYPVILGSELQLLRTVDVLLSNNIAPRRYFYPSLNNLPYLKSKKMPYSDDFSKRVICLPLYADIKIDQINLISKLVIDSTVVSHGNKI